MLKLVKQVFIGLLYFSKSLCSIVMYDHVKLNNQQCMAQPTLINLHPNEYSEELCHYLFAVNLDRCMESCNTLRNLFNKVCFPNKTGD